MADFNSNFNDIQKQIAVAVNRKPAVLQLFVVGEIKRNALVCRGVYFCVPGKRSSDLSYRCNASAISYLKLNFSQPMRYWISQDQVIQ